MEPDLYAQTFLEISTKCVPSAVDIYCYPSLTESSRHPVSSLQRFGLARTPAPPWVALHRVIIPQHNLSQAADYLVTALGGEEMAYKVAGGSKWWQVRAGPGVEAEWIVMRKDWEKAQKHDLEKGKDKGKHGPPAQDPEEAGNGECERVRASVRIAEPHA